MPNTVLKDVIGALPDVTALADKITTTDEERLNAVNERMKLDMSSDNWVAKAVRPILAFMYSACFVWLIWFGIQTEKLEFREALVAVTVVVGSITNFYFVGRTKSKTAEINAKANIEIVRMETKSRIKEDKRDNRESRRERRRSSKEQN